MLHHVSGISSFFSLCQPHSGTSSSIIDSPIFHPSLFPSSDSPLCTSITPSLFHSRLKTYLFLQIVSPVVSLLHPGLPPRTIARTVSFELLGFCFCFYFFLIFSFLGRALDLAGRLVSFWAHTNLPYRIVSYRITVSARRAQSDNIIISTHFPSTIDRAIIFSRFCFCLLPASNIYISDSSSTWSAG